jgi:hypothetical protein
LGTAKSTTSATRKTGISAGDQEKLYGSAGFVDVQHRKSAAGGKFVYAVIPYGVNGAPRSDYVILGSKE